MATSKKRASSSKPKKTAAHKKTTPAVKKSRKTVAKRSLAARTTRANKKKVETTVEIKPAKGRPILTWVGKKALRHATTYPAQLVNAYKMQQKTKKREVWKDWPKEMPQSGLLFHGDNKDVLAYLLANGFRGNIDLIYIDPPFDSGADYVRKVNLRGTSAGKPMEGEAYGLGEQIQYTDIWTNDNYLQFMFERLLLLRELLSDEGTIFLHCDDSRNHYLRCLLDEVFGPNNFLNEIVHVYGEREKIQRTFNRKHQTILWYAKDKSSDYTFNAEDVREEFAEGTRKKYKYEDEEGRSYRIRGVNRAEAGGLRAKTDLRPEDEGKFTYRDYADKRSGPAPRDWFYKPFLNQASSDRANYPTQKNPMVIERLIMAASNEGDIVLDAFVGSGTTALIAQRLGRKWIGADINKGAIQTTIKVLEETISEQFHASSTSTPNLPGMESKETPKPAQLSFAVYRVNDYDLQIQHSEAFNLAVEHLGMTRTKTDYFFDGTLGKKLVRIVPFNHPVTPLDLEEVKKELNNRPDEARDVVVVGLGKELATEAWLEEWNKLRKQGNLPNKIEIIELRSDPKYGGFFTHDPAKAKISFKRTDKSVEVTIDDFISPTILERLHQQNKDNPLFQPQIDDWRSMVDSVMIDTDYDGKVFNIMLADVPEKKNDLVEGKYTVGTKKGATVAVKVTDMLGEEVLVVRGT